MSFLGSTAYTLATWFGCGLSPVAPGTVGSLGAVPLHLLLRRLPLPLHVASVVGVTAIGIWSAGRVAHDLDEEDPQLVVIDEVAGALIAMGAVRAASPALQLLALGAFRGLDILKPGPIAKAERARPPGVGIMLDDLLAGAGAAVLARMLK